MNSYYVLKYMADENEALKIVKKMVKDVRYNLYNIYPSIHL